MKSLLNHLYNGPHAHLINVLLFIGGLSIQALISGLFGVISLGAKALYDIRQLRKQSKQAKADETEERIKAELYNEYLKNQKK